MKNVNKKIGSEFADMYMNSPMFYNNMLDKAIRGGLINIEATSIIDVIKTKINNGKR